ncbi:glycosyltransferase [Gramella sp. KN1008]|uniref:glycosyltransferase n=1 Tax=Gramella sp. KN1008 TaxID=2529298 RepID=UPI0013F1554D|nr:glycosyltransferase [Gramella sp. KN1008]
MHIYQGDLLKPRLEHAGIKVYSLDLNQKYAFNKALEKLIPIYLREKPDIIHATLFRSEIIARKLKQKFPNICLIGSFVSNAYSSERLRRKNLLDKLKLQFFFNLDRRTVKYVDYFISNSHTIKDRTCEALRIDSQKVEVIYRGRSSSKFDPKTNLEKFPYLNNHNTILLNVSRLIPLKGQEDLLEALPEIIKRFGNVSLIFAGHGAYREFLEEKARFLKVEPHVHFLGRVDNINKLLLHANIFLYPSYSEGLPGALIEAMMAERIIICSNIPENLECVDSNSAIIYKKGNVSELSTAIIKVLNNPEKYRYLGENARKQAIKKFELGKRIVDYQDFYKRIKGKPKNKKFRILHLIQKPQNRGAETFACQLANHQINLGNEVKIVSIFKGNSTLPWHDDINYLQTSSTLRLVDVQGWKKLNKIIRDFKPDVVQANAGDTLKYAVFSKKIFRWKTPIIFRNASEVGKYLNNHLQRKLNDFLYQNVDQVISVSRTSRNDIITNFPILKNKTIAIPVGIENRKKIISEELQPSGYRHIIHVGGFTFEKNHEVLVRIFEKILKKHENVHLHLLGDGPLKKNIEKLVKQQSLQKNISFYGYVNDPLPYIKAADVLVLPSIIEGLPGVILESMYCKTPVVAFNVGGMAEIVGKETGHLIPPNNEEAFVYAVRQILKGDNSEIISNAYNMVETKYLNRKIAERFQEAYNFHF